MINWEELKHIHVIRKLEEILGQWFHTDIFFVDERGQVRNYDLLDRHREFKNPLSAALLAEGEGPRARDEVRRRDERESLPRATSRTSWFRARRASRACSFRASRSTTSFWAACSLTATPTSRCRDAERAKAKSLRRRARASMPTRSSTPSRACASLSEGEKKYFYELVDLVAQEIVTFHTEISKREERINALNNQLGTRYSYDSMIGKAKPMQELYSMLDKIKNSESTVLVQGENGTGKELIARAIHFNSPRKDAQFVTVNCSAFNENLLDSELFGHVKGSFTGAIKDKKGLFEVADKGTLFLDEIGDMSPDHAGEAPARAPRRHAHAGRRHRSAQSATSASSRRRTRTSRKWSSKARSAKIFTTASTSSTSSCRRFATARKTSRFSWITSSPAAAKRRASRSSSFAKRAMEKIFDYPWPGNIRELENEIERLIVLSGDEPRISAELLSPRIRDFGENAKVQGVRVAGKLKDALEELEKTMIREGLRRTNWNKSRLAKELGISRAGLIMKVEKYGLDKRRLTRKEGETAA